MGLKPPGASILGVLLGALLIFLGLSFLKKKTLSKFFLEGAEKIQFHNEIHARETFTDKTRLKVILNNLISNAIKYHHHDQSDPWIKVRMLNGNKTLSIIVSDNGPGINVEHQAKIFDMFYRGTERSKGSGLGLYIVKETIAKMNGSINVESVEGQGTSFFVKIPVSSTQTVLETSRAEQPLAV